MVASTPMATITTVSMLPGGSLSPGQSPAWAEAGKTQGQGSLVKKQPKRVGRCCLGCWWVEGEGSWVPPSHLRRPKGLNRIRIPLMPCPYFSFSFFFFFFFLLFRATPVAYGGSQARDRTGTTAAGLHHSHSNTGSLTH